MVVCSYYAGASVFKVVQEWNVKPRRGRQRKYWCKVVDHLFSSLGLDKAEWLEDIRKGSCSLKSFLGVAGEGRDERESGKFEEGLNSKVKFRTFGKIVEFKKYLRGVGDAGTRLLSKFRSGTHGLNEELGRHSVRSQLSNGTYYRTLQKYGRMRRCADFLPRVRVRLSGVTHFVVKVSCFDRFFQLS